MSCTTNCRAKWLRLSCASSIEVIKHRFMDKGLLAHIRLFLGLMVICLWGWPLTALAEKAARILIISNDNGLPYREAIAGFRVQIAATEKPIITEQTLRQIQATGSAAIGQLKSDLIFALGNESLKWASQQTKQIPIVATMVLKENTPKQASNITTVSLGYSLETQFRWMRKFFPHQNSVAILYNPVENAATINMATQICQQAGLKLVAIPVPTPKELPFALEQLAANVEVLLAIPDETVMSVNTAKEVLLASFRNKVPMVGLSENWVKSGAFYALSWDYNDLGAQSALQAQKILNGTPVSAVPPEHPRKVTYSVNAKIAEHMKMEIPNEILKNAKSVFN